MKRIVVNIDNGEVKRMDDEDHLEENFKVKEFACPNEETVIYSGRVVRRLQLIRWDMNIPLTVTSGYRTIKHNSKVGGYKDSKHMGLGAVDIVVPSDRLEELHLLAEIYFGHMAGIGVYDKHIHMDLRESHSRW